MDGPKRRWPVVATGLAGLPWLVGVCIFGWYIPAVGTARDVAAATSVIAKNTAVGVFGTMVTAIAASLLCIVLTVLAIVRADKRRWASSAVGILSVGPFVGLVIWTWHLVPSMPSGAYLLLPGLVLAAGVSLGFCIVADDPTRRKLILAAASAWLLGAVAYCDGLQQVSQHVVMGALVSSASSQMFALLGHGLDEARPLRWLYLLGPVLAVLPAVPPLLRAGGSKARAFLAIFLVPMLAVLADRGVDCALEAALVRHEPTWRSIDGLELHAIAERSRWAMDADLAVTLDGVKIRAADDQWVASSTATLRAPRDRWDVATILVDARATATQMVGAMRAVRGAGFRGFVIMGEAPDEDRQHVVARLEERLPLAAPFVRAFQSVTELVEFEEAPDRSQSFGAIGPTGNALIWPEQYLTRCPAPRVPDESIRVTAESSRALIDLTESSPLTRELRGGLTPPAPMAHETGAGVPRAGLAAEAARQADVLIRGVLAAEAARPIDALFRDAIVVGGTIEPPPCDPAQ